MKWKNDELWQIAAHAECVEEVLSVFLSTRIVIPSNYELHVNDEVLYNVVEKADARDLLLFLRLSNSK